jgi:hypothetical protein
VEDWGGLQQRRLVDSPGCCKYAGVASSLPKSATSEAQKQNLQEGIRPISSRMHHQEPDEAGCKAWERGGRGRAARSTYRGHA